MDLAGKLRQARLEAGLSQRQLCGDRITRNMLSCIENGTAQPSISTVVYLAGRLNVPAGFLLAEESDDVYLPSDESLDTEYVSEYVPEFEPESFVEAGDKY